MLNKPFSLNNAPDPNNFAGFLIWQIGNKWEKYVNNQLKTYGTTQAEYFHLIGIFILSLQIKEVTQVELAKVAGGSIMNTSKTLKSLELKGWVNRTKASDPRAKKLQITEEGRKKTIELARILGQANTNFYGKSQSPEFIKNLQQINKNN